ncbi:hypothetical protein KIMH_14950 [Bombiscardovia apis]|uniref:Cell surface protein n=1 Tax=Bombiscardovia apis TaxID=2932182 RepID=A0ABM8BEL3_9BIFI|nr:hypothetical protein KIMH_14950 [Bombiscardovia apis]
MQARADDAPSQQSPALTVHVQENGSTSDATGVDQVQEMLPKDAKPVGAGYVYSATKLSYDAMQTILDPEVPAPNQETTEKVLAKLTDYLDRANDQSTIYYGSTDDQGTITVKTEVGAGTWLAGATYDPKDNTLNGGTPASFPMDVSPEGTYTTTYWLLQFVGAPKDTSATADAFIVQLPSKDKGSPDYNLVVYPKVKVNKAPEQPIQPTPKKPKAAPVPAYPKTRPKPKAPDPAAPAVTPVSCPKCVVPEPCYAPSGPLVATGSAVAGFVVAAVILTALAAALMYGAYRSGRNKNDAEQE